MQAIEAVVYVHEQGVIHSDLRPENFLVHGTVSSYMDSSPSLDLWLCDFGGSKCEELGLDGQTLPDDPFFDPREPWVSSPATDIFSLGSIIYTILTRRWPYREGASPSAANDKAAYETKVNALFMEGRFPDLSEQSGRGVIEGCWDHHYKTAKDVLDALKTEMESLGIEKLD